MAVLRSPVFILCILLFVVHQLMQKVLDIRFPLFDRHLDNLLAMPVLLTLLLAERRWLFKRGRQYSLPALDVIVATVYVVFVTEIIFPVLSANFTADWRDVIFYALGSIIFWIMINKRH